jgi:hypothetical protein
MLNSPALIMRRRPGVWERVGGWKIFSIWMKHLPQEHSKLSSAAFAMHEAEFDPFDGSDVQLVKFAPSFGVTELPAVKDVPPSKLKDRVRMAAIDMIEANFP